MKAFATPTHEKVNVTPADISRCIEYVKNLTAMAQMDENQDCRWKLTQEVKRMNDQITNHLMKQAC